MEFYNFAFLDANNSVVNIAVFDSENPETELLNSVKEQSNAVDYKSCTTYGAASINGIFIGDRFVLKQPYPSWILNTETYEWESPIGPSVDNASIWDEDNLRWIPITEIE